MAIRDLAPGGLALMLLAVVAGAVEQGTVDARLPFMPERGTLKGLAVTLDAAGGGAAADPNAVRVGGFSVDELNMLIVAHLYHHLRHAGAVVYLTRYDDRAVGVDSPQDDLLMRARRAVETRSHLLVSIRVVDDRAGGFSGLRILTQPDKAGGVSAALLRRAAAALGEAAVQREPLLGALEVREDDGSIAALGEVPTLAVEIGPLRDARLAAQMECRGGWRAVAVALFEGILRVWQTERSGLDARRAECFPGAPEPTLRRESDEPAADGMHVTPVRIRQTVAELWREKRAPESAQEAEWLLNQYFRRVLTDRTFFYVRTEVEKNGERWAIRGATNFARLADAAVGVLREVGCTDVQAEVEILPSKRLGDRPFAIVTAPMAMTWAEPREGALVQTQLLFGERLILLDEAAEHGYVLGHGADGYVGWVRQDSIVRVTVEEARAWESSKSAIITSDVVCGGVRIPAGARLPVVRGPESGTVELRLPPGRAVRRERDTVHVSLESVRLADAGGPGPAIAAAALDFLTTPYVFGGRSRIGLDCSGLTGVSYASAGLALPRDAKQQVLVGRLVGTPWMRDGLAPGDLLFFCDESGTVIHTGISLGGQRFVHSAPPEVQVSSFDPADPLYSDHWLRAFAFARRPLLP